MAAADPARVGVKTVDTFPRQVVEHDPVWISMPDGTRLAARIWLPADAEADPVPAILEPIPYRRRDGTAERDALSHPWMAGHGYAVIRVDLRGSGDSDGVLEDEYLAQEQADGLAVLAWAAAQPWCTGRTGVYGISWGGFAALQIAALKPPSLGAIVAVGATHDRFAEDIHFKGGCLLTENPSWASYMFAYQSRPPDPNIVGDRWRDIWMDRLTRKPLTTRWIERQTRDAYWRHGSVCENWRAIQVPTLSVSGWVDGYVNPVFELLENAQAPVKALLGPWGHRYPHIARPHPAIGFLQEVLRWWDRWLKDLPTGVEDDPALRAYIQEPYVPVPSAPEREGRWLSVPAWPPVGSLTRVLYLTHRRLSAEAGPTGETAVLADPLRTAFGAGRWLAFGEGPELSDDQRADDAGCAVFDTRTLHEPMSLLGRPELRLSVASDRPLAQVVARLCAVAANGAVRRLSWGVLNLAHRDGSDKPRRLQSGRLYDTMIRLDGLGDTVAAGERLRLVLSSSYWPMIWPSPTQTRLTIRLDQCRLALPTASDGAESSFEPPEASPPLATTKLSAARSTRSAEVADDGEERVQVNDDRGRVRFEAIREVKHEVSRETWRLRPGDPSSAVYESEWRIAMSWDGGPSVDTVTRQTVTADARRFRVTSCLEAQEHGTSVASYEWDDEVDREFI
ncbi:CocE/NonD family hydrolase [Thalassobaculum sp.]|uniref:CocE/NonD family hydrolase n=1 Tax=Thalassobaculum sp. TaxID=2022740 RepID=UPI0032EF4F21